MPFFSLKRLSTTRRTPSTSDGLSSARKPPSTPDGFQYSPLNANLPQGWPDDAFRLLDLLAGEGSDPIRCELRHSSRTVPRPPGPLLPGCNAPWVVVKRRYATLSYTWGSEPPSETIWVNGSRFMIAPNLMEAFKALRETYTKRTLWVDAICINQTDTLERNKQVAQMQEIYASSDEVLIWLGPSSPTGSLAMSFTKTLCEALEREGVRFLEPAPPKYQPFTLEDHEGKLGPVIKSFSSENFENSWMALGEMFRQPWWERAWIIQELACSPEATFNWGTDCLEWTQVALIIHLLRKYPPALTAIRAAREMLRQCEAAIQRADSLAERRWINQAGAHSVIQGILELGQSSLCRDPRDKIYAMLGLTNPAVRKMIEPDYNKSVAWVYAMAVKAHLAASTRLNILLLIQDGTKHVVCPSWAVDLTEKKTIADLGFQVRRLLPFQATDLNVPCSAAISDDMKTMYVNALKIDIVEDNNVQGRQNIFQRNDETGNWSWNVKKMVNELEDSGGVKAPYQYTKASIPATKTGTAIEEAIYDVVIAGCKNNPEISGAVKRQEFERTFEHPLHSQFRRGDSLQNLEEDNFLLEALSWTKDRTLIVSEYRYLGLAPAGTKPGDHLCVLFGLAVPCILRPQQDGTWSFVGGAYVPGLMRGEAMEGMSLGIYKMERLQLR